MMRGRFKFNKLIQSKLQDVLHKKGIEGYQQTLGQKAVKGEFENRGYAGFIDVDSNHVLSCQGQPISGDS